MKYLFTYTRFVFLIAALCALSMMALAQEQKKDGHDHHAAAAEKSASKFLGKGDGIETCPVTGEAIASKDIKADFHGRTVYFCCPGCLATAQKDPDLYVKKTEAEQIAAIKALAKPDEHAEHAAGHDEHAEHAGHEADNVAKFLGKGDGVETCPVTGEPISKDVKIEIDGRTVYACCAGCLDTIKKNPDLYLKKSPK